jgi:hypothetical protein
MSEAAHSRHRRAPTGAAMPEVTRGSEGVVVVPESSRLRPTARWLSADLPLPSGPARVRGIPSSPAICASNQFRALFALVSNFPSPALLPISNCAFHCSAKRGQVSLIAYHCPAKRGQFLLIAFPCSAKRGQAPSNVFPCSAKRGQVSLIAYSWSAKRGQVSLIFIAVS